MSALGAAAVGIALLCTPTPGLAAAAPGHATMVGGVPSDKTPNINDGSVVAIYDAGTKVIVGGSFTRAQDRGTKSREVTRKYLLAFDKATGKIDNSFVPALDGGVTAVIAGPAPGTVFVAGQFNTVNGQRGFRKLALLNIASGTPVAGFKAPAFNGMIKDIARVGGRLLVGGIFSTAGSATRNGLATLNATTGALDNYLTVSLTGHHNWTPTNGGASAGVGAAKLAVSPDGKRLVVIGNFKKADNVTHDQVVRIDLGPSSATIANWNTDRYSAACKYIAFDSYVRDVAFAPNGTYFVVVTTGASYPGTLCDATARWDTSATGAGQQPTWVAYSGGDTFLSVGISEQAVYVGGHFRWLDNPMGRDQAAPGAVPRASIAALDPASGLPLSWNPGRHPRGYGVTKMLTTPQGLWLGSDQEWLGNREYKRARLAFFPLNGGQAPHSTATKGLPGNVYQAGRPAQTKIFYRVRAALPPANSVNNVTRRSYDGARAVGAATSVPNNDNTLWSTAKGAFWVGGDLFYGMNGQFYRRSFNGTTFGTPAKMDPYHDPKWDKIATGSGPKGSTYAGMTSNFYAELPNVTAMFYTGGRLYYALSGQSSLFWRWFTPDTGTIGAERTTVKGTTAFADTAGLFLSGNKLYVVSRSTGNLSSMAWSNGAPTGAATVRSGPGIDKVDWRAPAVFVGP
ncbi:hypothetical protein ABZ671_26580 [Micromonospora sp. NPDC006766]|uniref:hypothetical protein n=1 Tax=Micromonospora sp. NPDC006766 TaxID=3154778 RepID=UPI00340A46A2